MLSGKKIYINSAIYLALYLKKVMKLACGGGC